MSVDRGRAWGWQAIYKGQTGQWAQLLHRVTGLGVVVFLLLHIADTALLGWGPQVYDTVVALYHHPVVRVLEIVLVAAVLYHALNGLRVTLIDFWDEASLYQERIFWGMMALFFVLFIPAAIVMLLSVFA